MPVRLQISAIVFMHVQPIMFGAGLLAIPLTASRAAIPVMIGMTFVLSAVIALGVATRRSQRCLAVRGY